MTEILEAATMVAASQDECIYCGKKEKHENKTKKNEPDLSTVKSLPDNLKCSHLKLEAAIPGKYTKANHHIIPVKQCFLKVKKLAQIALSVSYDINSPTNGIALPTVCNMYNSHGKIQNFGQFSSAVKDEIAMNMMQETGMQWHVGHHAYELNETASSDAPDEGEINHLPYDKEVQRLLVGICIDFYRNEYCQTEKDESEKIKAQLDEICKAIRTKLDSFAADPKNSTPFYVSKVASKYAFKS